MSEHAASCEVHLRRADVETYAEVVFGYVEGQVPIRLLREKGTASGTAWAESHPAGASLAKALIRAAERAAEDGRGLFVVPATVRQGGRARAEDVVESAVLVVDLDEGDVGEKLGHLEAHVGPASLIVASGGRTAAGQEKLHAYWLLNEAARDEDLDRLARLRGDVAAKAGADRSFRSLHQPIRVPGSIHGKNGHQAAVRIVARRAAEYELSDLEESVRAMPPAPGVEPGAAASAANSGLKAADLMLRPIRAGALDGTTRFEAVSKVIGHHVRAARLGRQTLDQAWGAVDEYNAAMIAPPWPEERLRRDFDALVRRDAEQHSGTGNAGASEPLAPVSIPQFSEDWLADRFAAEAASNLRYVPTWGAWFRWTGTHWHKDETGSAQEQVRAVCRAAAAGLDSEGLARRIASQRTIRAVERLASSDRRLAVQVTEWDPDPMLLNTPAGIVDLETGEVTPHDPLRMLTQIAAASPGKSCPSWKEFLGEITGGDPPLARYLARVCGYCLTGSTQEQVFFFLHGSGANGKSVFLQTIAHVLGSYAGTAPLDTFMLSRSDRHPTDLAGLRGRRLVTVAETEPGRSWAESRIKSVTGGDAISARFMHRDFFEFVPNFKLIVAGNHRPVLNGVGEAMRRRLHLIPFPVTIPAGRRDGTLPERLVAEADGILGWMLEGLRDWQQRGLDPPMAVRAAAEDYFSDEDVIGQWIEEHCATGAECRASSRDLYASWRRWTEERGHLPESQRALGEALRSRGFAQFKSGGTRGWRGIELRARREGREEHA